ncbi:hypothetical protein Gotur_014899 [Gossypium turneri]
MHSFGHRLNGLLTFSVTILAIMCAIASLSDNLNTPSPTAEIKIMNINWFQKQPQGNDEVVFGDIHRPPFFCPLFFTIIHHREADFKYHLLVDPQLFIFVAAEYETPKNSLNQVSLWDAIIPAKEHAKFWIHTSNKYRFVDQGNNLRGKKFNLTLHWHVMPKTGKMFADKIVMAGYSFPEEYR